MTRSLFASLLVVVSAAAPAGAAVDAPPHAGDAFAEYRNLSVESAGVAVDGREMRNGNLRLMIGQGGLFPIKSGSGETVGALVVGQGRYAYTTADPADQAAFQSNLVNMTQKLESSGYTVTDTFRRALILLAGESIDSVLGAPWEQMVRANAPSSLASDFEEFRGKLAQSDLEFDHHAALIAANGPPDRYVYVEIDGDHERVGYEYDAHRGWFESYFTFRKFQGYDYRFRQTISRQAIAGRDANLSEIAMIDASIAVATGDNRSGTIVTDMTVEVVRDRLRIAVFGLANNRDPDSARWQSDKNALRVTKVLDAEGRELPFSHRYDEIAVDLGAPRARGEKVGLRFKTEGEIFCGAGGERYDNYFDLFFVDWFPRPLAMGSSRFTFRLSVETAKPFRPLASGDTVSFSEDGDRFVLRTKSDTPVWDVAVFAGKYKVKELKLDWITIRAHAYAIAREEDLEALVNVTALFADIYRATLSPLPFKELDLVEMPTFLMYGISPPGVVILTSRTYKPKDPDVTEIIGNRGVNSLIAHEVAHQWFGHRAWPKDPMLDNWLTESLAEYASGLAMAVAEKKIAGEGKKVRNATLDFSGMLAQWRGWADEARDKGSIRGANRIVGPLAGEYRYFLLYGRGPLMLHMFRTLIGDERYLAVVRRYLEDADTGPTTTARFVKAARDVVGLDFDWFFEQ